MFRSIIFIFLLLAFPVYSLEKPHVLDGIAAIINDGIITESELDKAINIAKKQMQGSELQEPAPDILRKQVMNQLINQKIQLQLAEQAGIQVKNEEVTAAIKNIAAQNKVPVEALYAKVLSQGMTPQEYQKEIKNEIMMQQIQQNEVGSKISVDPKEVDDFMRSRMWQANNNKEYHLENILISLPDSPTTEQIQVARKKAENLLTKINHGLSFQSAASAESGDSQALQGGDLGWRKLPEIPTLFADQIIHMKENDIAGPIQAPNGFHLIFLAGIRDQNNAKLDAKAEKKQVLQLLYQRKFEEQLKNWIAKIRSQAFINIDPEGA